MLGRSAEVLLRDCEFGSANEGFQVSNDKVKRARGIATPRTTPRELVVSRGEAAQRTARQGRFCLVKRSHCEVRKWYPS